VCAPSGRRDETEEKKKASEAGDVNDVMGSQSVRIC
jgi:hypothetical protein